MKANSMVVRCPNCGAMDINIKGIHTFECPYCDTVSTTDVNLWELEWAMYKPSKEECEEAKEKFEEIGKKADLKLSGTMIVMIIDVILGLGFLVGGISGIPYLLVGGIIGYAISIGITLLFAVCIS